VSVTIPKDTGKPQFTTDIDGKKNVSIAQGTIIINRPEQTNLNLAGQRKNLILALYNIKDGSEAFNDPSDCNFGDAVYYPDKPQERRITVTVEQSLPKDVLAQAVTTTISPDRVKKGQFVELSIRFANPFSISTVIYSYTLPDGTQKIESMQQQKEVNVFKATIPTDSFKTAGMVNGKFMITTREGKTSEKEGKFEVFCGGEDNNFYSCRKICEASKTISAGFKCYNQDEIIVGLGENGEVCCRS